MRKAGSDENFRNGSIKSITEIIDNLNKAKLDENAGMYMSSSGTGG
jgi:hypothetical protein